MRVFFYFLMTRVVQDLPDETQSMGMVIVLYSINLETLHTTPEGPVKLPMLISRLPIQVIATHSCTNHVRAIHMCYLSSRFLGNFARVRSRVHFGSDTECQYALATFGIPRSLLTVTSQGDILVEDHLQWMNQQWEREKEDPRCVTPITTTTIATTTMTSLLGGFSPAPSAVTVEEEDEDAYILHSSHAAKSPNNPSLDRAGGGMVDDRDVLFGKGRGIQERPGNLRYRQLIERNLEMYNKASKLKKRTVCEGIVQAILDSGGLFLRQEQPGGIDQTYGCRFTSIGSNTQWVMVDHEAALEKVSHGFRNKRNAIGQTVLTVKAKPKAKLKP
jgi:hypothetical protein